MKIIFSKKGRNIASRAIFLFLATHNLVMADVSQQPQMCAVGAPTFASKKMAAHGNWAYVSSFDPVTWSGHLRAVSIGSRGEIGSEQWDAAEKIPSFSQRKIFTWNSQIGSGKEFLFANLSEQQKADLGDGQSGSLLQYLRGETSKERRNGGPYRNRVNPLGDIVNSVPLFVKDTDFGFRKITGLKGSSSYPAFVESKKLHTPAIYVGANDGMLHQFNATTGVEGFAYVPNSVYRHLKKLSDPNYGHHYFVDGQITEGDAYLDGAWGNYLIGSTGAGAKSIFALDITHPDSLGAATIKWELNAEGDFADLGYVLGRAYIARSRTGDWVAVFGNGYDSKNNRAVLYVVNLSNGALIKKLEGVGEVAQPNGLSPPAFLFNSSRELITAYAGDLQGNLWKFDLSDSDPSHWKIAFEGKPLFVAKNGTETQPITSEPIIEFSPQGGYMVIFGTGKYVNDTDQRSRPIDSLYGIWDPAGIFSTAITTGRNFALIEQKLIPLTNGNRGVSANVIDWKSKRGWYIDFNVLSGEHIVGEPVVVGDVLSVATYAPGASDSSLCNVSGISQLLAVNYLTGAAYGTSLFDDKNASSVVISPTAASPVFIINAKKPSIGNKTRQIKPGISNSVENSAVDPEVEQTGEKSGRSYEIAINKKDGSGLQIFHVQPSGAPILRTWRQIFVGY